MEKQKSNYKKPNIFVYYFMKFASYLICKVRFKMKLLRNELKGAKGKKVVICNHEAATDFFAPYAFFPGTIHLVMSNSFMRTVSIKPFIEACGVIGKNQFATSVSDMRKMKSVTDNGATLVFYPAGLMSESGASTPIPAATAKTLKWFDADIYVGKVSGTYLANPKWAKVKRMGKTTFDVYKLISAKDFANLSGEEAAALIEKHLGFDAYRINAEKQTVYKNGDNLEGIENVLYKCPACGEEYSMKVAGGKKLYCEKCGYTVMSDKTGILHRPDGIMPIFKLPSDWHAFIENSVYEKIKGEQIFKLETIAEIQKINDKKHRFERVGKAVVTLDIDNFVIDGVIKGSVFRKEIFAGNFPMLPFKPGKFFEIQDGSDIFRVFPKEPEKVMEWIFTLKAIYKIKHEG